MFYGVSYYPEHKTEDDLKHDIKLLIDSGINTVRMGEFAWCRWEPAEGEYHFEWMDAVVEELGKNGIKTIICTPTACPPAWMIEQYPDILYVDNKGVTRPFGGRRHYCYNNKTYREYSRKIAEELGKHYGRNPYVLGFQIDNEPAQEGTGRCHCKRCNKKFRKYLEKKYGTIEEFNRRSGGIFWSQEYTHFGQINIPVNTIEAGCGNTIANYYENPTVRLEFERFASDSQIKYQNIQLKALKMYTDYPVTTNATGLATNSIDYYKSTKKLDNYAFDSYPELRDAKVDSFPYAFARGIKGGKPFWVMEFMSGGGHRFSGSGRRQPNPGALKQAVIQSLANGAELMLHFQFRTFPFGAEQLNYAIVDMDGVPRRRYQEMMETAQLLDSLKKYENAEFKNEVAICFDYDTYWALRIKPVNDPEFNYVDFCNRIYEGLAANGVNADVIPYNGKFDQYKAIILPSAFILNTKYRNKLKEYVKQGGVVLATFLTSVKNTDNVGYTETLPAGLTDLFDVTVEEVEPIFPSNRAVVKLKTEDGEWKGEDRDWCDLLDGKAKMIGVYQDSYKKDSGVISKNKYGKGYAYYLGVGVSKEMLQALLSEVCRTAKVSKNAITPMTNIEVIRRYYQGQELYYIMNFTGGKAEIALNYQFKNALTGKSLTAKKMKLEKNGFAVLLREK